jgi:hypothetical protein
MGGGVCIVCLLPAACCLLPAACCLLPAACCRLMTSADRNDLLPATQEKLEWVRPKISLMEAGDAEGKQGNFSVEVPKTIGSAAPS